MEQSLHFPRTGFRVHPFSLPSKQGRDVCHTHRDSGHACQGELLGTRADADCSRRTCVAGGDGSLVKDVPGSLKAVGATATLV
eukprot:5510778-Amphidinium_carterae.1